MARINMLFFVTLWSGKLCNALQHSEKGKSGSTLFVAPSSAAQGVMTPVAVYTCTTKHAGTFDPPLVIYDDGDEAATRDLDDGEVLELDAPSDAKKITLKATGGDGWCIEKIAFDGKNITTDLPMWLDDPCSTTDQAGDYDQYNGTPCNLEHSWEIPDLTLTDEDGEPCNNETGTCKIYEDPHIENFDRAQVSLFRKIRGVSRSVESAMDKWMIKSSKVSVQARFQEDALLQESNMYMRAVAIGGPFLGENVLIVGSLEDQVTWNGESILESSESTFDFFDEGGVIVKIRRGKESSLVEDLSIKNSGVNVDLPLGVSLIVNRLHHHVNVAITMPPQTGQDGLCGNFNGIATDDSLDLVSARFEADVTQGESFFASYSFE